MSMLLYIYAVRLDNLWSVFGSSDRSVLARIKEVSSDKYRSRTWHYNEIGHEHGDISIDEAIEGILDRSIARPECATQYGLALELICELLGTELPNDEFTSLHRGIGDVFRDARLDCAAARTLSMPRYPIPLPLCDDGPLISCLTSVEAAQSLHTVLPETLLNRLGPVASEEDYERARFYSWLQHAITAASDLVTFFY